MGAPSTLARLMKFSKELEEAPKANADTNGAVHTKYMPTFDVEKVLGTSSLLDVPITSKARMVSPSSCKPYEHDTLRSLLGEILIDIAHNILRINDTVEACLSGIAAQRSVSLTVVGPTGHLTAVQRCLKQKSLDHHIRRHREPEEEAISRGGSDLIAIVGMAGRFPGSETIEAFFEDLVDEKIQLKKVRMGFLELERFEIIAKTFRSLRPDSISINITTRLGRGKIPCLPSRVLSWKIPVISTIAYSMCLPVKLCKQILSSAYF